MLWSKGSSVSHRFRCSYILPRMFTLEFRYIAILRNFTRYTFFFFFLPRFRPLVEKIRFENRRRQIAGKVTLLRVSPKRNLVFVYSLGYPAL